MKMEKDIYMGLDKGIVRSVINLGALQLLLKYSANYIKV